MRTRTERFAAAAALVLLAGCVDVQQRLTAPAAPAASTSAPWVSVYCPAAIAVGQYASCWATLYNGTGTSSGFEWWWSSAPSVVQVGGFGSIYGNSAGFAWVYAEIDGVIGSTVVQVATPAQPLAASISGPSSITQSGTYTWTAQPSGGTGSYAYQWEASDGFAWYGKGTGQSYTDLFHSNSRFTAVRVKVTSGGQSVTATMNVSVVIPQPPPSVSISGPSPITAKGTYTYTASAANVTNPTFTWSERDCVNGSCGPWSAPWSTTLDTYQRVLSPANCTTESRTWQLRAEVTRQSDGQTAESIMSVSLCGFESVER